MLNSFYSVTLHKIAFYGGPKKARKCPMHDRAFTSSLTPDGPKKVGLFGHSNHARLCLQYTSNSISRTSVLKIIPYMAWWNGRVDRVTRRVKEPHIQGPRQSGANTCAPRRPPPCEYLKLALRSSNSRLKKGVKITRCHL